MTVSPEALHLLTEGLRTLSLLDTAGPEPVVPRLAAYLDILLDWNERMNLVGPTDEAGAVSRHLLDSLSALPVLDSIAPPEARIADIGSGAGLPGIPVALVRPSYRMTLVERSTKKCGFLRAVTHDLALENVSVVDRDLGEIQNRWDVLMLRAVSEINAKLLEVLRRHLHRNGVALLYKGRRETVERELSAASVGKGLPERVTATVHTLDVPFLDAERHLVEIRFSPGRSASRRG